MPSSVNRLHVTGTYTGLTSNFIVWLGPPNIACDLVINGSCSLLVNELIGTGWRSTVFDGTYQVGGAAKTVSIVSSSGVRWTFTEVR